MRKIIILIGILFNVLISNAQNKKLSHVQIDFEDFSTLTTVSVNCDGFYSMFKKTLKIRSFDKKAELTSLSEMGNSFSIVRNIKSIDVRGIITFDYEGVRIKYCFDQFGVFIKGGVCYNNKRLKAFIGKKLYPNGI